MESVALFIGILLSLALIGSMRFNPRRLEAIGYSLSVLFLQVLISDYEDVFFICPQFPIYVSPKDVNLDPDTTMADSKARGVYVDTAVLLARCIPSADSDGSTAIEGSITDAFAKAHQDRNFDLYDDLDITSLEVPVLEERKRAPTRHPRDLEDHVYSILSELEAAEVQVLTQARILFSSRRFADQNLVILLATAGRYYRLAVAQRDHKAFTMIPDGFEIEDLADSHLEDPSDLGEDSSDFYSVLVNSSTIEEEKHRIAETRSDEKEKHQLAAHKARELARWVRVGRLKHLKARARQRSELTLSAGKPPYTDEMIEAFYKLTDEIRTAPRRYLKFFEPEPLPPPNPSFKSLAKVPKQTIESLAKLRLWDDDEEVVFTSVIRVGSPVSDKFVEMIREYLSSLAQTERDRRNLN